MTECFSLWLNLAASQRLDNANGEDFSHLIVIAIDSAHLIIVSLLVVLIFVDINFGGVLILHGFIFVGFYFCGAHEIPHFIIDIIFMLL